MNQKVLNVIFILLNAGFGIMNVFHHNPISAAFNLLVVGLLTYITFFK